LCTHIKKRKKIPWINLLLIVFSKFMIPLL
jgi:hypothetical protein